MSAFDGHDSFMLGTNTNINDDRYLPRPRLQLVLRRLARE